MPSFCRAPEAKSCLLLRLTVPPFIDRERQEACPRGLCRPAAVAAQKPHPRLCWEAWMSRFLSDSRVQFSSGVWSPHNQNSSLASRCQEHPASLQAPRLSPHPVLWLSPTTWSSSSLLLPHPKLPSDCLTIRLKAPSCQELSGLPLLYAILAWVTLACTHTHTIHLFSSAVVPSKWGLTPEHTHTSLVVS